MKKLLVIVGPTGTGKTDLALEAAKKFDGEIISADSRQIYIGMDVGTGKEIQNSKFKIQKFKEYWIVNGVPIYLYDLITPDKTFSVAAFQQLAYKVINEIHEKNKLPILVGGTGLYVRAIVAGLNIPKVPPNKRLRKHLESKPLPSLINELEKVDPETADKIDRSNPRRVVRALEVYHQSGEPLSKLKGKYKIDLDTLLIGLGADRSYLYRRVDNQVEEWFKLGLIEEVRNLLEQGFKEDLTSMTSLGYRQIAMYLQGKISLEEAKQRIKWEQHSYIRRQLTWFRKEPNINWFDVSDPEFRSEVANLIGDWLAQV